MLDKNVDVVLQVHESYFSQKFVLKTWKRICQVAQKYLSRLIGIETKHSGKGIAYFIPWLRLCKKLGTYGVSREFTSPA